MLGDMQKSLLLSDSQKDRLFSLFSTQAAANVFLQPGVGWRYTVAGQTHGPDGRRLTVRYTAAR